MSLWWMQPGWADARCASCGEHIQASGGDPDWGYCWPCMQRNQNAQQSEREHYEAMEREHWEQEYARIEIESWSQP